tara:strand:- start:3911 stop:4531 length:621 start_codon:yes stop_codon:yes gene_type:complete
MNKVDIFPTTIFQFQLEDEEILNDSLKIVEDLKMAQFNFPHRVLSSHGDLHKREDLKPLYNWFHKCLEEVKQEEDLQCDRLKISLSWANWSPPMSGGGHPLHRHNYSYLSAVFYFTEGAPTTFLDPVDIRGLDTLEILKGDRISCPNEVNIDAERGKLILFPGWLRHCSLPHGGDKNRFTISFNSLPDGKINGGPGGIPVAEIKVL